jgi:signal transduction histidine kinase
LAEHVLELFGQVIEQGQKAILELPTFSSEDHDFRPALPPLAPELTGATTTKVRMVVEGVARPLRPTIRDQVYRIGREGLLNAFHHSRATRIEAELYFAPGSFGIRIRDNGRGIDPQMLSASRDCGLSSMREGAERIGAHLRLLSRVAAGTEVHLSVPGAY